jgi:hypothetical protein
MPARNVGDSGSSNRSKLPITPVQVLSIWFGIGFAALCAWAFVVLTFAVSIRLAVPPLFDAWERLRRPAIHSAAVAELQRRCARLERRLALPERNRKEEAGGRTA